MNSVAHHPEALEELAEAIEYYLEHATSEIAVNFDNAVDAGIVEIAQSPLRFSRWRNTRARKYVVPDFPYVIFYIDYPEYIRVLAIAHTSRRPGYWKTRIAVD